MSVLVAEQLAPSSISDVHGKRRTLSEKANLAKEALSIVIKQPL